MLQTDQVFAEGAGSPLDRQAGSLPYDLRLRPASTTASRILKPLTTIAGLAVVFLLSASAAPAPWHHPLYLANGGYWPQRVAVTVSNNAPESVAGAPLKLALRELAGTRVESLRVCRTDGVELLFDVRDAQGRAKRSGPLTPEDNLIVPVECPAHAAATLYIYAGNSQAWAVPDFLPASLLDRASPRPGLRMAVGEVERLQLKPAQLLTPRTGADWRDWAEVRVRELSNPDRASSVVRVNLRKAFVLLPGISPDCEVRVAANDHAELTCCRLGRGGDLLFTANLLPKAEQLFQVGFRPESKVSAQAASSHYEQLMNSGANLVMDGSFESDNAVSGQWLKPAEGGPHSVIARRCQDALFGYQSLELTVRENTNSDWVGWRSREIPVRPGATYLVSGWLKGVGLKSWATIHAHFHDAQGSLTRNGAMVSTQPTVSGDSGWTNSIAFFQAPPDAASIQIHLTMNTEGTLRHDGIILCEVVDGEVTAVHPAKSQLTGPGLRVWEVNPLVKIFPDTLPLARARHIELELARNEHQAFQLAVRAEAGTSHLSVAVSPLRARDGNILPAVKVERVGYVPIDYPSAYYSTEVPEWCRKVPLGAGATDGWGGWWPDPLAPGSTLDVPPGQTQPLWFTVHAPTQAAPGRYRAEVTIRTDAKTLLNIPLTVEVLPFTLPRQGRLRAIFDLRFGPGGGFGSGMDSAEDYRKWLRFIAEHRLGINEIHPPPKFSYRDGKVTMDTTEFDKTAGYCFDELGMNVAYTPDFFYMFGWAYPPKKLFGLEPFTPAWTVALQQAYRQFSDHVRERGWHDKFVYYISDEPHFQHDFVVEQMKKLCALLHQVDPAIPIYSSTWRHCPAWDDALDLWGIGQYGCFPVDAMEGLQRAGKQMWFTCDGQMATDTPFLATERLLPYYCFKYGVRGFEFWGLAWWTYDPWKAGWHQFIRQSDEGKKYYWIRYPDGDGYLAYPGKPVGLDGPASTIRLEQIRQGLQDYEAIALLADLAAKAKAAGRPAAAAERALAMVRDLVAIPNAGGLRSTEILPDPDRVRAVRKAINAALLPLVKPTGTFPSKN